VKTETIKKEKEMKTEQSTEGRRKNGKIYSAANDG